MIQVNVHEAKTQLSRLIEQALNGEEVVIARAGEPVVRLVPTGALAPRVWGQDRGQIVIGEDFDAPLPDDLTNAFADPDVGPSR